MKKMMSALLISGMMLSGGLAVLADSKVGASVGSEGTVGFEADTTEGEGGALSILEAPNYNFDTHTISNKDIKSADSTGGILTVKDFRGEDGNWNLTVKMGEFENENKEKLTGVSLSFNSVKGNIRNDTPELNTFEVSEDTIDTKEGNLEQKGSLELIDAKDKAGKYDFKLSGDKVVFNLDGKNAVKAKATQYKTALTWVLAPGTAALTNNPAATPIK